ncbi:MAG: histidine phosphatase family protein [Pseudomonadota bacterium]
MSRPTRRLVLAQLGLLPMVLSAAPQSVVAQEARARDLLQRGEAVVYFRHGATTHSGVDRIEWPRSRQRLLSDLGIAQSRLIGAAFRDQDLPVGDVLASPFARCRDMAEIAFGRVEERMELLGLLSDAEGRAERVAFLRGQLSARPENGNRIVVSHRSNIAEVAGVMLGEGDGVIVEPNGAGFDVLATLAPDDW